jgi:hypothetical protein
LAPRHLHPDLAHRLGPEEQGLLLRFRHQPERLRVPLSDLDLNEGAPVRKLRLAGGKIYAGNVAAKFEPSEPMHFMPVNP